jgi:hypothetical protein
MSTIEERLARDIAAVTGGVVVTESDLRDARDAVDELIDSRRQRDRRTVLAAAAAAVLVLVLGVTAFLNRGADDQTAPPAHTGRTTSDPDADFLVGRAPSPDLLQGVWRLDNGGAQMRFSAPDLFSYDTSGQLFHDPAVHGTYVIDGDLVTLSVDAGRSWSCGPPRRSRRWGRVRCGWCTPDPGRAAASPGPRRAHGGSWNRCCRRPST